MDNEIYFDIRTIMKKFIKHNYWQAYTAADIFYFHNMRNKRDAFLTFIDSFYGDSFGLQLFNNRDGFNYVHDIFTASSPDQMMIADCDSICPVFVSADNLTVEERDYLRKRGLRVKPENNLIIYRFKRGYDKVMASKRDEREVFKYIEFLDSLLRNDKKIIDEAFKLEYTAYCDIDFKDYEYNLIPRPLPFLEKSFKNEPINEGIYEELRDKLFVNDEALLFTAYLPFYVDDLEHRERIRPLGVYLVYPSLDKIYFSYIIDNPKGYSEKLWTIIYDAFMAIGKPAGLICNARDVYACLKNTAAPLNIELKRDKNEYLKHSGLHSLLARFYQEELLEASLSNNDALELLEAYKETVNSMNYSESELDSYEDEAIEEGNDDNSSTLVS